MVDVDEDPIGVEEVAKIEDELGMADEVEFSVVAAEEMFTNKHAIRPNAFGHRSIQEHMKGKHNKLRPAMLMERKSREERIYSSVNWVPPLDDIYRGYTYVVVPWPHWLWTGMAYPALPSFECALPLASTSNHASCCIAPWLAAVCYIKQNKKKSKYE